MDRVSKSQKLEHIIRAYQVIQEIEMSQNSDFIIVGLRAIRDNIEAAFPTHYSRATFPFARKIAERVKWFVKQILAGEIEFKEVNTALYQLIRACAIRFDDKEKLNGQKPSSSHKNSK